jgi:hypothetical protein
MRSDGTRAALNGQRIYIILRGRWCNIIGFNVHAPCEDRSNYVKDNFYEELGLVFDQYPRYDMKIVLGDFNAKEGREDSNDNGVRVVNFATSKNLRCQKHHVPSS